ncbi:hypothetical protein DICVIV_01803 [Dictyocaulus viviparus]|uniref:Uncharacterized protein n=1 Tax=Dictyocaulus viviparus TaxID=29172 RepID=A0A0D8Y715_DICVI|nr:hypothetical protein DICVIV_01803 [Dictyocaulus viviparus]
MDNLLINCSPTRPDFHFLVFFDENGLYRVSSLCVLGDLRDRSDIECDSHSGVVTTADETMCCKLRTDRCSFL